MSEPGRVHRLRSEHLAWRAKEGEIVALDLYTANYLAVNRSGAVLWDLLLSGGSHDELLQHFVEHFGIEKSQAERDLEPFLSTLAVHGLLER